MSLTYGGNFRHNTFDVSLAPTGKDRNEGGAYVQDEIFLGNHVRWVVGGRVDKFSSIEDAVFSPRTTLLLKPSGDHTLRVSFNRAFRAPSFINNNIAHDHAERGEPERDLAGTAARFVLPVRARLATPTSSRRR